MLHLRSIPIIPLRNAFVENNAYKTTAFVEQRWRIAGNTGFNESIF